LKDDKSLENIEINSASELVKFYVIY